MVNVFIKTQLCGKNGSIIIPERFNKKKLLAILYRAIKAVGEKLNDF
jgi:hypothetical protein